MSLEEGALLRIGAEWLGRKRLSVPDFRNQFGLRPNTVLRVQQELRLENVKWLLRTLWWLKEYPTEQQVRNFGASPSALRQQMWPLLERLKNELPQVISLCCRFFFFFFFLTASVCTSRPVELYICRRCSEPLFYFGHNDNTHQDAQNGARRL
jgi:hypothetical protein